MYSCTALSAVLTCKCVCATEKLVEEMGENEQQEIIEELSDLDALLPDLEAKVTKQCYHVHYITLMWLC